MPVGRCCWLRAINVVFCYRILLHDNGDLSDWRAQLAGVFDTTRGKIALWLVLFKLHGIW